MQFAWAISSSAACLALQSSHISNGTIFGIKVIEHEVCVLVSLQIFPGKVSFSEELSEYSKFT
jgi:hypothetical protein